MDSNGRQSSVECVSLGSGLRWEPGLCVSGGGPVGTGTGVGRKLRGQVRQACTDFVGSFSLCCDLDASSYLRNSCFEADLGMQFDFVLFPIYFRIKLLVVLLSRWCYALPSLDQSSYHPP